MFIELRAKGLSFDKIAKKLNVSKPTLIKLSKEFEHEINNFKIIELENLYEKYYMKKEKRITLFGDILKKINDELQNRDLSKIPTEKLFDLMIKYSKYLKDEKNEMIFREECEVKGLELYRTEVDEWKVE
ncbi:MAG: hypothetical protein ABRQ37_29160 [Candidatus Eremiobacterota bacterium]